MVEGLDGLGRVVAELNKQDVHVEPNPVESGTEGKQTSERPLKAAGERDLAKKAQTLARGVFPQPGTVEAPLHPSLRVTISPSSLSAAQRRSNLDQISEVLNAQQAHIKAQLQVLKAAQVQIKKQLPQLPPAWR